MANSFLSKLPLGALSPHCDAENFGKCEYLSLGGRFACSQIFPWLVDENGNWRERNDVYLQEARLTKEGKGSPLSATSNGNSIGPELGFGCVHGAWHEEQKLPPTATASGK